MNDLHIPVSIETPEIRFEFPRHRLALLGVSCPENATGFYAPIRSCLQGYLEKPPVAAIQHGRAATRPALAKFHER